MFLQIKYSNFFILFAVLTLGFSSNSHSQNWQWANKIGLDGGGNDYGTGMAKDVHGNIIVTGRVKGNSTFGMGASAITLNTFGDRDIFICKYDSLGNFVWAKRYGGLSSDYGYGIVTDTSSNIFITGYFTDSAKFESTTLFSKGGQDIFIAKVSEQGNLIWVKSIGGSTNEYALSIALDKGGNSFITGAFTGSVRFGADSLTCAGGNDFFIAKFDTNGTCLWGKRAGNSLNDIGNSIVVDGTSSSVYVCGYYTSNVTFGSIALNGYGGMDIFTAKYDSNGNCSWAKRAGSTNHELASDIALDRLGNLYVTGGHSSSINFGTITTPVTIPASTSGGDVFLAKYDTIGNLVWAKKVVSGTGVSSSTSITINKFNNPVFCGSFKSTCYFDGVAKTVQGNNQDVYVTEYNSNGNVLWVKTYKGVSKSGIDAHANAVITDNTEHTYLTGGFLDTVSFDGITLVAAGISSDVLTGKLSPFLKAAFTASKYVICQGETINFYNNSRGMPTSYNWHFYGTASPYSSVPSPLITYDSAGTFNIQLIINNGIASDTLILTNYIIVNPAPYINLGNDTSVCVGATLTLNAGSGFSSYSWQDSSSNSSLNVTNTGQYYVQISDSNFCVASDSINVIFDICSSVEKVNIPSDIMLFPNPTIGSASVIVNNYDSFKGLTFNLFNNLGNCLLIDKLQNKTSMLDLSGLPKGIYTYTIDYEFGVLKRGKLVID